MPVHFGLRLFLLIVLAVAFLITIGLGLAQAAYRSWTLPVCWHCGARQVRYSMSRRTRDNFLRLLLLVPYRCWLCQRRFYGFRSQHSLGSVTPGTPVPN